MNAEANPLIGSPEGVLAVLAAIVGLFFYLEHRTGWKLFNYLPPLIFIYATPVLLNNIDVIPSSSPVYDVLRNFGLPAFIVLMLMGIDVGAAVRIMGRGVAVMLMGTAGIVVGGVLSYLIVHGWMDEKAYTAFGALTGSWIGGTGNMGAVADALQTPPEQFGLAVLADNAVYVVWLPILLGSRAFADRFNRWARVPEDRIARMEAAALAHSRESKPSSMRDYLYLACVVAATIWLASTFAGMLPAVPDLGLSTGTWKILLLTTFGIGLSFTGIRHLPGSHELAMAIIYLFVARMGASASLSELGQAPAFLVGAFIWIFIHGAFCLAGAWLFRVDVHSAAIASAANVGGAASAPVVAAAHRESLVPASVLMALIGYAMGNYLGILTGSICKLIG